jgi:hypothetical protein
MYTGKLINDLMAAADRARERSQQQRIEQELHEIFSMQIPVADGDQICVNQTYLGAA